MIKPNFHVSLSTLPTLNGPDGPGKWRMQEERIDKTADTSYKQPDVKNWHYYYVLAVIKDNGYKFEGFRRKWALKKAIGAAIWQSGHQIISNFLHERHRATNTKLGLHSSKANIYDWFTLYRLVTNTNWLFSCYRGQDQWQIQQGGVCRVGGGVTGFSSPPLSCQKIRLPQNFQSLIFSLPFHPYNGVWIFHGTDKGCV